MTLEIPRPDETVDLAMGDSAIINVRRYARPDAVRLFLSNGNGFAIDGYYPFWGPLAARFELIAFDFRNHGRNPIASSGRDGHTYAQMTLDLERVIRTVTERFNLWPRAGAFGGPVKLIAADPDAKGAPAPAFANRALAEEFGYVYEAIPGTGHLLQIQKPEECRRAMLSFLDDLGIGA